MSQEPLGDAFYFCDESSFIDDEYMAVAGLAIPFQNLKPVVAAIKKINSAKPGNGEVKWATTKNWNLAIRKGYVDTLMNLIKAGQAHFHVRFSPMDEYDHEGPRKRFDTVSKAYYQLLLHRAARYYGEKYRIRVRPDDGECTSELKRFAAIVGRDASNRYERVQPDCIESVVCMDSKSEPMLQFLDVPLGALSAYRNSRHLKAVTSESKRELAEYTFKKFQEAGVKDIRWNFDDRQRLSIWNVVPKRRGPGS